VIILNSVDFVLFWNDVVSNGNCVVLVESRRGYVTFDFVDGLWWCGKKRIGYITVMGIIAFAIEDECNIFINGEDVLSRE